jgi:hypothetical protein
MLYWSSTEKLVSFTHLRSCDQCTLPEDKKRWLTWEKVYLTVQFLMPIVGLYSFKHAPNTRLRSVAQRTLGLIAC